MSDIRAFGAVGDGIQDDTEAIRHAIDQGDGKLVFEPGEYKISETIHFDLQKQGPVSIDGSGGAATIKMTGPGPAFRLVGTHGKSADPLGIEDRVWKSERMPVIRDIALTGSHENADGIELVKTFQPTISGVHIRQCQNAISIRENNRNVLISNCHLFHNRGTGVLIENCNLHQINVIGNHISYNRLGGIRVVGSQVYNLQITGNDIEYNNEKSHGTQPVPVAEIFLDATGPSANVNEVTIASNTIQATVNPGGCNIRIIDDGKNNSRAPGLFSITGNVIGSQENNIHLTGCHGIAISGNVIYSCEKYNSLIEDSDQIVFSNNVMRRHRDDARCGVRFSRCKNSVVAGCVVEDEHPNGQSSGISTMELVECERINLSSCQLLSGVPYCLDVVDSNYVNVAGCTIGDVRNQPVTQSAVRFSGNGIGNRIGGCIIGPSVGDVVDANDRENLMVHDDNLIVGNK